MVAEKGLMYMGCGVSGGEEGARNGEQGSCATKLSLSHGNNLLWKSPHRAVDDAWRHPRGLQIPTADC